MQILCDVEVKGGGLREAGKLAEGGEWGMEKKKDECEVDA